MPNRSDPTKNQDPVSPPADQSAGQTTTPPVPPIIFPQSDLPPLSPEFQNLPETNATSPTPGGGSIGSSAPPDISSVIPKAKKKFGGGKIIATILGLIVLVGGVAAGILLIQQKQLLEQKAAPYCPVINGCVADNEERRCNDQGQMCTFYIGEPGYEVVTCTPGNNNAGCPAGYYCMNSGSCYACVKNQECFYRSPDNCGAPDSCGGGTPPPSVSPSPSPSVSPSPSPSVSPSPSPRVSPSPSPRVSPSPSPRVSPSPSPRVSPSPSPSPRAIVPYCVAVTTYDTNWVLIPDSERSLIKANTTVNFCVSGFPTDNFDEARFTINGTLQTETTTRRPGSTDFCQSYTIPSGTRTLTVLGEIHDIVYGWFGGISTQ